MTTLDQFMAKYIAPELERQQAELMARDPLLVRAVDRAKREFRRMELGMGDLNADRVGDALKEIDEVMGRMYNGEKKTGMNDAKEIVQKHTGRTPAPTPKVETTGGFW